MFGKNRGRKSEEELRSYRVVVHVTAKEKDMLTQIAKKEGMDVSTFIRTNCIYKKFNNFFKGV